jgi:5-methylcytosine-specific restriction endonuclease McrA
VCQVPVGDVGICGEPATCVDHIIPRSRGGSDDPRNLRASCTWHNLRKWDRLVDLPRARTSRAWL